MSPTYRAPGTPYFLPRGCSATGSSCGLGRLPRCIARPKAPRVVAEKRAKGALRLASGCAMLAKSGGGGGRDSRPDPVGSSRRTPVCA